ncbi:MAG TPA: tripartite tricarboxylate transporter substrate-binding protein [Trueperaceae bacterium]|nr:tripartite tricarboxylate transporter substrate-binding protein [Trueperaceae bacterium]
MRLITIQRIRSLLLGLALFALAGMATAQVDALRIMAPAGPGGGWDGTARAMQAALRDAGVVDQVEVFNVPGAGGTIGLAQLASSESGNGDILMIMGLVMVGSILTNDAPVGLDQSTPIARLTAEYEVVVVPAASPHQTLDDLIAAFQEDPGAVAFAGGSAGGIDHILVGLLAEEVGVDPAAINYIPYSGGGEALAAILGSQVAAGVSGYSEWAGQIEAGELRVLAISSPERIEGIDAPTLMEQGVELDIANWRGVVAAPNLSAEQRDALVATVDALVASDEWQAALEQNNWLDAYMGGDEFDAYLASELERVRDVLVGIGLVEDN